MRFLLSLLLLASASISHCADALVLIQPARAGPATNQEAYIHARWILWPASVGEDGSNRLLSLTTGVDWQTQGYDFSFKQIKGGGGWEANNFVDLRDRGYFAARSRHLGSVRTFLVTNEFGAATPAGLELALNPGNPVVVPSPQSGLWPQKGLLIHEARSWDDVSWIAHKVSGRTLVIEFPPAYALSWSRYWLYGGDWPSGLPIDSELRVPGLVSARHALSLLLRPTSFAWQDASKRHASDAELAPWGGANRWLAFGQFVSPWILFAWALLTAAGCLGAIVAISSERSNPWLVTALESIVLLPAALALGGSTCRALGLSEWAVWYPLSWLSLIGCSGLLERICRRRFRFNDAGAIVCFVGLVALATCDPLWSPLSALFSREHAEFPQDAIGALYAYLVGFSALLLTGDRARLWFIRAVLLLVAVWGFWRLPWFARGDPSLLVLPVVVFLVVERVFPWPILTAIALVSTTVFRVVKWGFAWNPQGLAWTYAGAFAVNTTLYVLFFLSPAWLGSFSFAGLIAMFGDRFFFRQMKILLAMNPHLKSLLWAPAALGTLGLFQPLFLHSALVATWLLGALLLASALRAL